MRYRSSQLVPALTAAFIALPLLAFPQEPPAPQKRPPQDQAPAPRLDLYGDPLPEGAVARCGTVRLRHGRNVSSAVFTPDGKTLISGDDLGVVRTWDLASGNSLRTLSLRDPGNASELSMAVSPDGNTLVTGEYYGRTKIWELTSGKLIREFPNPSSGIGCVAFAPDGRRIATIGAGAGFGPRAPICVWDVRTGEELVRFGGGGEGSTGVSFSPSGKSIAAGGAGNSVLVWDSETGRLQRDLKGHEAPVTCVAFSPDGDTLASGSEDATARLWDLSNGKELHRLEGHKYLVYVVVFSPNGKTLASRGHGQTIRLWEVGTGKELLKLDSPGRWTNGAENTPATSLAFSPDGKTVASGGKSNLVHLYRLPKGDLVYPPRGHESAVTAVVYSPDGNRLLSASTDGTVRIWEPDTGRERKRLEAAGEDVQSLAMSPDGRTLAGCSENGVILLWNSEEAKAAVKLNSNDSWCHYVPVCFSRDGKLLVTLETTVWDVEKRKRIRNLNGGMGYTTALALSPDGKVLAVGSVSVSVEDRSFEEREGVLMFLEFPTGRTLGRFRVHEDYVDAISFAPDGKTLAFTSMHDSVSMWEVATATEIWRVSGDRANAEAVAYAPDGRSVASGSLDGSIHLWAVNGGKEIGRYEGHQSRAVSLAFSPDGETLASGSWDGTVIVWKLPAIGARGGKDGEDLSKEESEKLWADLMETDAAVAYGAVARMENSQGGIVSFLRDRLAPAGGVSLEEIERLIGDLDSEDYEVRKNASSGLERIGDRAKSSILEAIAGNPSPEMQKSVTSLLALLSPGLGEQSGELLRATRAIRVLERVETEEAVEALKAVATRAHWSVVIVDAKAALARLDARETK